MADPQPRRRSCRAASLGEVQHVIRSLAIRSLTCDLANGIVFAMTLTLDKMGRLVIPKPLRDRFALAPGHELEVQLETDGFRLRSVQTAPPLTVKSGLLVCTSELPAGAWDLGAFLDQEREQRSRQLGGV